VTEQAVTAREAVRSRYGSLTRSFLPRYGVAVISALAALVLARLIVPVADAPVYSILVGAVVVAVWYGGFLPGVVALAIAWALGPFLLVPHGRPTGIHSRDDLLRWGVPLVVALMIVWISFVMRRGQQRAATAAIEAEETTRQMELPRSRRRTSRTRCSSRHRVCSAREADRSASSRARRSSSSIRLERRVRRTGQGSGSR
jgi:K+-sensing histidine kinase KdpD